MTADQKIQKLVEYCEETYGTEFDLSPGACNIVYLEGATVVGDDQLDADLDAVTGAPDIVGNADAPDRFNDVRMIISFHNGVPVVRHCVTATTEPGYSATHDPRSAKLNGVARIAIGCHPEKWRIGYHKKDIKHPALVQAAPITVHRDKNRDGKRTGDPVTEDVRGLNQHGTKEGVTPTRVGGWSYGCLVGADFYVHLLFIALLKRDPRYVKDNNFLWDSTVVDWSKFEKWMS